MLAYTFAVTFGWPFVPAVAMALIGYFAPTKLPLRDYYNLTATFDAGSNNVRSAVLDPGLGLPTDFAYQVVKQVGNYAEIFARNLTPLGLERGINPDAPELVKEQLAQRNPMGRYGEPEEVAKMALFVAADATE